MAGVDILAHNIKIFRQAAGMSQKELGDKIGVSGVAVMRYEKGQREPKIEMVKKIANACNVPYMRLYGWDGDQTLTIGEINEEMAKRLQDVGEMGLKTVEALRRNAMNAAYDSMNGKGQQKAVENVQDLAKIPEYQRQESGNAGEAPNTPKDTTQGK